MKAILPLLALAATAPSLWANAGAGPWANGAYYPGQLDGRYSANVYNNTQARFDTDQMDNPSGNSVRTDTFSTNTVGTNTTTNIVSTGSASVVSGVLGFGIRNGTPSTGGGGGSTTAVGADSSTVESIGLDTSHNYFVIYVDGNVFAGQTAAGINLDTQRVSGSLWKGAGQPTFLVVSNTSTTVNTNTTPPTITTNTSVQNFAFPTATAGGYFNAKIKSDKSPFVFKGAGEISTAGTGVGGGGVATYPFDLDGIKSSDNSISGYSLTGRDAP